jgi:hypothetical protein
MGDVYIGKVEDKQCQKTPQKIKITINHKYMVSVEKIYVSLTISHCS